MKKNLIIVFTILIALGAILYGNSKAQEQTQTQQTVSLSEYQRIFNNFIYYADKCAVMEQENMNLKSDNENLKLAYQRMANVLMEIASIKSVEEIPAIFKKHNLVVNELEEE